MESQDERQADARISLAALAEVRVANASRLQRPRRYWILVASMLAIFALIPLLVRLPPIIAYSILFALFAPVVAVTLWKQPITARKVRVRGAMWLPLVLGVSLLAICFGFSSAAVAANGWLWPPLALAPLAFAAVYFGGPALDRYWAHTASYASARGDDDV